MKTLQFQKHVQLSRKAFVGSLVSAAALPSVSLASANRRHIRKRSVKVDFSGIQPFDGTPSLTEITATSTLGWAGARFANRIFRVTREFEIKHFDFRDEGFAVNLVPFEDGSLCFRQALLEGGASAQIRDVLRLSDEGIVSGKIRFPDDVQIDKIERLGTDTLVASAQDRAELFVATGETFSILNMGSRASDESASMPMKNLRRANDGAVWYLRGTLPNIIGRVGPDHTVVESLIKRPGHSYLIAGLTPIADDGMLLFLASDDGQLLGDRCIVMHSEGNLTFSFLRLHGAAVCEGNFDKHNLFWSVDGDDRTLHVASLFPLQRLASTSLGPSSLVGCDATQFARFDDGILIPGLSSVDYYTLS